MGGRFSGGGKPSSQRSRTPQQMKYYYYTRLHGGKFKYVQAPIPYSDFTDVSICSEGGGGLKVVAAAAATAQEGAEV